MCQRRILPDKTWTGRFLFLHLVECKHSSEILCIIGFIMIEITTNVIFSNFIVSYKRAALALRPPTPINLHSPASVDYGGNVESFSYIERKCYSYPFIPRTGIKSSSQYACRYKNFIDNLHPTYNIKRKYVMVG